MLRSLRTMVSLQNVVFSQKKSDLPLYVSNRSIENIILNESTCSITFKNELSLNTYFNSLYTNFWLNQTNLASLFYDISFEGSLRVSLFFSKKNQDDQLIYNKKYLTSNNEEKKPIPIPLLAKYRDGRFYLVLKSLDKQATLHYGRVCTAETPLNQVFLSIVICTYHKEEFVHNNLDRLNDLYSTVPNFMVYIADNGKSFQMKKKYLFEVCCLPNNNLGGAGGFARGMLEASKNNKATHVLLMDDDIEFDPEIVFRMISFFHYTKQEIAISGNMIDSQDRLELFEAGALYSFKKMDTVPHLRHLHLDELSTLNVLALMQYADYAAWFCCGLPVKIIQKFGLPLPIFIRGDDIEYGVRLLQQGIPTVVTPGVGVWHESFYTKKKFWTKYYMIRNLLIINYVHSSKIYFFRQTIKLWKFFIGYLCLFQYSTAKMIFLGLEDFLKGPDFFKKIDIEQYHKKILACEKDFQLSGPPPNLKKEYIDQSKYDMRKNPIKMLIVLLTINGNLLPKFLLKNKIIQYQHDKTSFQKQYSKIHYLFGYRYVQSYNPLDSSYENYALMSKKNLVKMLFHFFRLNILLLLKSKKLQKLWQHENQFLVSAEYWANIFEKANGCQNK